MNPENHSLQSQQLIESVKKKSEIVEYTFINAAVLCKWYQANKEKLVKYNHGIMHSRSLLTCRSFDGACAKFGLALSLLEVQRRPCFNVELTVFYTALLCYGTYHLPCGTQVCCYNLAGNCLMLSQRFLAKLFHVMNLKSKSCTIYFVFCNLLQVC